MTARRKLDPKSSAARELRGRPRLLISMAAETRDGLDALCEREGLQRGDMIGELVADRLERTK